MFKQFIYHTIILLAAFFTISSQGQHRVVILSDISGDAEPDDKQSFIRLLLYSNELDIEGIIGTGSLYGTNRGDIKYFLEVIEAYGKVRDHLLIHSDGYPTGDYLKSVLATGQRGIVGMDGVGDGKNTPGSDLIISSIQKDDPRPLWICIWGAAGTLAQALWDIKYNMELNDSTIQYLMSRIRVYDIAGQDNAGAWIAKTFPDVFYIRSSLQFLGFSQGHVANAQGGNLQLANDRWFHQYVMSQGEYGSLYPERKAMYEGDTPSFLYLIPNGLSDPEKVNFGGWGGRFQKDKVKNADAGSHTKVDESEYYDFFMFGDAADIWVDDLKTYNNVFCSLFRWREEYQNDFAGRVKWTHLPYAEANHNPVAMINHDRTKNIIYEKVNAGSIFILDASDSYDPDGDSLSFEWIYYSEPGTCEAKITIENIYSPKINIFIPWEALHSEIHIVLRLKDSGIPNMFAYRRIVLSVQEE